MESIHLHVDTGAHFGSPEANRIAAPAFQQALSELSRRIQTGLLQHLACVDKKALRLELTVAFRAEANTSFDLIPNVDSAPKQKALLVDVPLDAHGLWWLEDAEILHRAEIAAVTGLAMLVRARQGGDAPFQDWLQGLGGFVAVVEAGVPRCPYCHTRVRNERTRMCRRCGNAWREQADGVPLPPAQAKRKPLEPAARPDGLAALAKFPAGGCRYPFNLKMGAHPRAKKLLPQAALWSIVNEQAPFGSDEGYAALEEFRSWRAANAGVPLLDFLAWTVASPSDWKLPLTAHETSEPVLAEWVAAAKAGQFDFFNEVWRRDTNIISSALAQLVFEGTIDAQAKPFVMLAVARQCNPAVLEYGANTRSRTLMMQRVRAAIEAA